MEIKEIRHSVQAVISTGPYENQREMFEVLATLKSDDNLEDAMRKLEEFNHSRLEMTVNNAKTSLIEKQYQNIKFYEVNGKKYPSVTSILGWNTDWRITEDELCQYGARGTIIHTLIEKYFKDKIWYEPTDLPELENEVNTLMSGSKGLTWKTCSYKEAVENIVKDVEVVATEQRVYNDAHLYCGRFDMLCKYKGELTLMDFKSGTTTDMRQLAAYSACLSGIRQLCIVPVGPADKNKCGYKKPIICTDIIKEFKAFLKARNQFHLRFGV
jgi:hypothetical protein